MTLPLHQSPLFPYTTLFRSIVWTVIPMLILISIAVPATKVLVVMEDTSNSDLSIKVTGYQWRWGYEYLDRKSTRLNSSHVKTSYAVFCLKKKKIKRRQTDIH